MSIAASVAEGLDVAAIPCSAMAADRVGILKSRILAPSFTLLAIFQFPFRQAETVHFLAALVGAKCRGNP
jgi:hypothetical protein